ncbi:MAG: hypothetical protein ACFCU5_06275 [Pleurocapsa sp.]
MANSTISPQNQPQKDQEIWFSLRRAIAKSSGFQRWQKETKVAVDDNLDTQVRRYLEETLATLAY